MGAAALRTDEPLRSRARRMIWGFAANTPSIRGGKRSHHSGRRSVRTIQNADSTDANMTTQTASFSGKNVRGKKLKTVGGSAAKCRCDPAGLETNASQGSPPKRKAAAART
jgi:hypothetical protein